MTAPCGRWLISAATGDRKASRGSSRGNSAAITRPAGSSAGMSFMECTAISMRLSKRASSISLVKRPLPPISASGRSRTWSPVVVITTISTSLGRLSVRSGQPVAHLVRLGERQF